MIPRDYILEWREKAPWPQDVQVEQDLIISRTLVEIFSNPLLHDGLALRGGTALYKLHLPAARYSEDIDLVQTKTARAKPMMDALHEVLNPWLGQPKTRQNEGRVTFVYRFESEDVPPLPLRLKVEINTREHFSVYGFREMPFSVSSRWFEENLLKKLAEPEFTADINPLLAEGYEFDAKAAAPAVKSAFIERLPGEPWKGAGSKAGTRRTAQTRPS